ncbi:MAG: nitrate reductase cytochrome c-type subunit; periplasmic nitrate reductase electron transfer subunit [Gammaproteobacteria bacterium]|nr:nitrate reductase cytochrome c-type subunit; periplasmic nitrate reductase electron transfer subunit [Gammaproteobacteria bacterium]
MTLLGGSSVVSASDVTSLRGGHDINMVSNIPNRRNRIKDTDPYERTWKEQPPIMPHKDYGITIKENRCMECHSDENYKEEEATQIGRSHYVDRSGASINHLAGNRYFCNQCHAPQFRLDPLVGNLFSTSTRR